MRQYFKKLCVILLFVSASEATVEVGKYEQATVSFSQNIQAEEGKVLLENFKESLKEASDVLHNAIGLPLAKVTVQIPPTWDISEWKIIAESTSAGVENLKSDFVIDGVSDVVFGKFPHAHQYGGCGVPGHQIVIPSDFFSENNIFPKGKTLAREWLKYRYGVFDENGYLNDPLYPLYYVIPGDDLNEVKVTDCTDPPVAYDFVNKSSGEDCSQIETTVFENLNADLCDIRLHNESLENVTSSIMYYQKDIDSMQHICNEANHNSLSPNKQNTLCSRHSIRDVVEKSLDLKSKDVGYYGDIEIEFTYVQQGKPKLVVAWEDTSPMKIKKQVIINAVQQLMIDLPEGSQFASFHFNDKLAQDGERALRELKGLTEKIAVMTNIASDFLKTVDADINLAIIEALKILSDAAGDAKADGTIIVITRSDGTLDKTLVENLKNSDVCLKLMFLRDDDIREDLRAALAGLPCTTAKKISLGSDEDTFEDLYNGMRLFLPSIVDDKETKTVKVGYLTEETSLSLDVDDSVETVTFWVYQNKQSENFLLTFNGEIKTDEIRATSIGDVKQMVYFVPEAGKIEFKYPHKDEPAILTQIKVTSKAGKYFTGEVLIHDTTEENSVQMPVIIYAFIRYGAYPVQNAHVSAAVQGPDGNNTTMDLYDNGRGDPDITQNDGIYSRYFIEFNGEGVYTVIVTVKNTENLASYGVEKDADYKPCCGSSVNGETSKLEKKFSEEFVTTFTAKSGRPEDGYEPSRIFDLRVDEVTDDKLTLKWTAPGAQADHGSAQSYEIKYFTTPDETKIFENGTALEYTADPQEGGKTEKLEIKFSDFGESGLHYIAMKANNANKTGELSNIIEISIPEGAITEKPDEGGDDEKNENLKKGRTSNETIGIIVAIILAVIVLIILIYLAIYFVVVKPKRKENKQTNKNEAPIERDNTAMNSITFIPASTIMEHHNEKTKAKLENKEPPIFKEEDFEDRNYQPTNEPGEGDGISNAQSDKVNRNGQPNLPPKSPKRTTPV